LNELKLLCEYSTDEGSQGLLMSLLVSFSALLRQAELALNQRDAELAKKNRKAAKAQKIDR